jgi:hypothetical protein
MRSEVTAEQRKAGLQVVMAVAETVREVGECPSGTVYAALVGRVTFEGYQKILGILQNAGLVSVGKDHMLRWTGPKLEVSQ